MARRDIRITDVGSHQTIPTRTFRQFAGDTAINLGEPVKLKAANSGYVIPLATSEPVIGTTTNVIGIAASDSTVTAGADGVVQVYMPLPGIVYRAAMKTPANVNTDALLIGKLNDRVLLDLTAGKYTVAESTADGATNGIVIVGGDFAAGTLDFMIRSSGTYLN